MFKKQPQDLKKSIAEHLRWSGIETPLKQKRLIDSWPAVVGEGINSYTENLFIKNQTLMVKLSSPALRSDLNMMKSRLVGKLNQRVGSQIITDIRFY